ncbi:hypothetical protein [Bradyrhizobium sp.]|uniref:hypothetical protein n=1 Tax=Bradyrhizobium sp. TaxID=376 RepID=UPI002D4BAECF|nr:hypothetical protein [Bradyrhizobium sp.]HZR75130.1 hypothetical protein [Bradyrhizobium sp.]
MFRWKRGFTGESLVIAIEAALASTREGPTNDEALAKYANKIVRKELDKRAISYEEYRAWRKHNRLVFTSIVDDSGTLIGFFDIFPLTTGAGEKIINGSLSERSLCLEHIEPFSSSSSATHLHLATILVNSRQKSLSPIVAREVLILKMKEFLDRNYSPASSRTFTAFAQSKAGEAFLKRCEFSMELFPRDNEQRLPLYVLRPSESERAISRLLQAERRFARQSFRSAEVARMDLRIESVELSLRTCIAGALQGETNKLPSHVTQKIEERMRSTIKKDPSADHERYKRLEARLEFCDLRELQDAILGKALWGSFEDSFGTKELLQSRFGKLADLRNAIRHSRTVDEVIYMEGEAAVIWFERSLSKRQPRQSPY